MGKISWIEKLYRYRYIVVAVFFVTLVFLGINGSSIGMWSDYFSQDDPGLLVGVSREVRSDEWALSTPMALSQYKDPYGAFSYFSNVVRGTSTDVFLEYGQPVRDIAVIFRPFHWGYLFLPVNMGLAFYWCGRYIALFMASFEMGMLISNKRKILSFMYAGLILWAPIVQWWFAINGLVEMLIYIQTSIVLFSKYMRSTSSIKRMVYAIIIAICAGGYVLTLYPAWMIPLGFGLLGLIVWVFLENYKQCKMRRRDWGILAGVFLGFIILMGYIFLKSLDTIMAIMNSAYPGGRFENGGGAGFNIFNYITNIWYAITGTGTEVNVCESAQFIDFFPLCYVLPLIVVIRDKIKDKLIVILMAVSLFLEGFVIFGYPDFVVKFTLLSNCQPIRVCQVVGFVNLLLMVRSVAVMQKPVGRWIAVVLSIASIGLCIYGTYYVNGAFWSLRKICITFIVFAILMYTLMRFKAKNNRYIALIMCMSTILVSGFLVNPIRSGCDNIYNLEVVKLIEEVHDKDPKALWVVEGMGYPYTNLPIVTGAPTVNSTNIYPYLERWEEVDGKGVYTEVYNRYAHISINVKEEGMADFSSNVPDQFTVDITIEDLKKIGVKYIFSNRELPASKDVKLSLIEQWNAYRIYEIE